MRVKPREISIYQLVAIRGETLMPTVRILDVWAEISTRIDCKPADLIGVFSSKAYDAERVASE